MNITELRRAFQDYRLAELSDPQTAPERHSRLMDRWLAETARTMPNAASSLMILAVGGYGRGELFPYSDIDLLVSLPDVAAPDPEAVAHQLFLPLWDAGFELGHGIRTRAETFELARRDFEVLCALLDARLLYGPAEEFRDFQAALIASVLAPERSRLVDWLGGRLEQRERVTEAHHIAPHLKEGRGGMRDAQTVLWLDRIFALTEDRPLSFLTADEARGLAEHAAFLSRTRLHLHRASRRKNDVLHLDMQPEIARVMGFSQDSAIAGVESFLSRLHRALSEIRLLGRLAMGKARMADGGASSPPASDGLDFSALAFDPRFVLELFQQSALSGIPLGWESRRIIQANVDMFPESWQRTLTRRFEVLLGSDRASMALEQMFETGFLGAFLPEFAAIAHFVQFDAYHLLPAGAHLIETVRHLESFTPEESFLGEFLAHVRLDPALRWAALLHDIGKGNGDHARKGADLVRIILARLGHDEKFRARCAFLVEHHLLLIHTATRCDLGEESVVLGLAQTLGSVATLDALTLLTWADSRATGPKAWTPWIENLLREIYFKTRKVLESPFFAGEHSARRLTRARDALRRLRPQSCSVQDFEGFLAVMPARYVLQTVDREVLAHIELARAFRASAGPFLLARSHQPGACSFCLTLVAADRPGLFARVCAALNRHGLSILSADLCTWDDGTVVDVFWVTEPLDMLYADQAFEQIEASLRVLFADEGELDKVSTSVSPRQKKVFALDDELVSVRLDNEPSDFHTVLTVRAPDVGGLLATISLTLYRLGLDLVFAKIATQRDKAMDTFHVRMGGGKIPDAELAGLESTVRLIICSLYV